MKNTIAGVSLIFASLVCVVLFACLERPRLNIDTSPACTCSGLVKAEGGGNGWGNWPVSRPHSHYPYDGSTSGYHQPYRQPVVLPDPNDESVIAINAVLDCRDIRLGMDDTTTFSDLFQMLKEELRRLEMPDIHIELDRRALQDANDIRTDSCIFPPGTEFKYPPMQFRSVLSRLLDPLDLTYTIRDETLLITTKHEVYSEQETAWDIGQVNKLERERLEKNRMIESAPERAYEKSMQTHGLLVAGLAIAWLAYFISGLCFLVFAREKTSQKEKG